MPPDFAANLLDRCCYFVVSAAITFAYFIILSVGGSGGSTIIAADMLYSLYVHATTTATGLATCWLESR